MKDLRLDKKTIRIRRNGYFIIDTTAYEEPLYFLPYAQAYIKRYDGYVELWSYLTHVATIKWYASKSGVCFTTIECYGLFSATTRRHISAFAKQFGLKYHDFKSAYEQGDALTSMGIPTTPVLRF